MWLEISPEISIATKCIVAIQSRDALNSTIYTESRSFDVAMPKTVLQSLIETRLKGTNSMSNVERLLTQIYQGQVTPRP